MRVEVEDFSDDAIACKDAIQVGPNYKPGGATFGAGTKTPSEIFDKCAIAENHFTSCLLLII